MSQTWFRDTAFSGLVTASALFAGACTGPPAPAPRPVAIVPESGSDDAATPVEIFGDGLWPDAYADFTRRDRSRLDPAFSARLVGAKDLEEVTPTPEGTLRAVVPVGLAPGTYDLAVRSLSRGEGSLPQAYRVVGSARRAVAFRFGPVGAQRTRVPFEIQADAVDAVGRRIEGYAGTAALSDRTGTLLPTVLGPFVLGQARATVTVAQPAAADVIAAQDSDGRRGVTTAFDVGPGPAVAMVFATAARTAEAGQCSGSVEIETRDAFGYAAPVEAVLGIRLAAAPPERIAFHRDAACTTATPGVAVAAGERRATFHFRSERAGEIVVAAIPDGLPTATQTQTIVAAAPAALAFGTPGQSVAVGACSAPVTVQVVDAWGNPTAVGQPTPVPLEAAPPTGFGFFGDSACTAAAASLSLAASDRQATFHFRGLQAGRVTVTARAAAPSPLGAVSQDEVVTP